MAGFMGKLKSGISNMFSSKDSDLLNEADKDYVELETGSNDPKGKIIVRPFVIEDFADIKLILDVLREGNTIGLINIRPLKDKDVVELKRAINKLKKTTDAIEGDIAGFGEDYVVVTPSFARIYRVKGSAAEKMTQEASGADDEPV